MYENHNSSGVEWLGQLPNHWTVKRLSLAFGEIGSGTTPPNDRNDYYEGDINWVTTGELRERAIHVTTKRVSEHAIEAFPTLRVYPPGTLLIAMYGATIGRLGWLAEPACTNQACCAFANPIGVEPRFVYYVLQAGLPELLALSSGGGQPNINQEKLRAFRIPFPTSTEQGAIAAFLDRETAKIDALVKAQRRLIELLKEKRQAVISHAVTKGLDPSAPMKDSGLEWLGQVPAHWEVRRLSSISTKITNGYVGPTRDIFADQGVRYLQSLHIKQNKIKFDVPYYVTPEWSLAHSKSILETGDAIIVQTGDIGQSAVVTPEFAGCNCHALIVVAPNRQQVTGEWISWVLNSGYGVHTLRSIQTGALHPHLNCGDVKDVVFPVPPLEEQRAIVDKIGRTVSRFDELSGESRAAVALLQERRAALISAAVTGKIDVRGLAPTAEAA